MISVMQTHKKNKKIAELTLLLTQALSKAHCQVKKNQKELKSDKMLAKIKLKLIEKCI